MKRQHEFAAEGKVSIWIGNLPSEAEFDRYMNLSKDFESDFGFKIDNYGIREGIVEEGPKPVGELLEGFSNWMSFGPSIIEACKKLGIERATTMIIFYALDFTPAKTALNPAAPLKFVGSFPFS
jgi:hypothetical protein